MSCERLVTSNETLIRHPWVPLKHTTSPFRMMKCLFGSADLFFFAHLLISAEWSAPQLSYLEIRRLFHSLSCPYAVSLFSEFDKHNLVTFNLESYWSWYSRLVLSLTNSASICYLRLLVQFVQQNPNFWVHCLLLFLRRREHPVKSNRKLHNFCANHAVLMVQPVIRRKRSYILILPLSYPEVSTRYKDFSSSLLYFQF